MFSLKVISNSLIPYFNDLPTSSLRSVFRHVFKHNCEKGLKSIRYLCNLNPAFKIALYRVLYYEYRYERFLNNNSVSKLLTTFLIPIADNPVHLAHYLNQLIKKGLNPKDIAFAVCIDINAGDPNEQTFYVRVKSLCEKL